VKDSKDGEAVGEGGRTGGTSREKGLGIEIRVKGEILRTLDSGERHLG